MPVVVHSSLEINHAIALWQNQLTASRLQAPSNQNRINVTDPATYSSWDNTNTNPNLVWDCGSAVSISTIGIAAHNMATSGATVRVDYSDDNVTYSVANPFYAPTTNDDIILVFPTVSARYWRLNFNGGTFSIGVVMGGTRINFPHAPIDSYTPLHRARKYNKFFTDSLRGQFLGNRVMAAGAETEVDLGFVDRAWLEGAIGGFERTYNQGGTFFYAGCPSKYPLDMGYCRANSEDATVQIEWIEGDKMANLSFGVRSFVG